MYSVRSLDRSYISQADYRKKYIVPYGRHSTVYDEQYQSWGYRGGEWKGMSQNSERYSAFLEELIQNGGMAKKNINMEFPEYSTDTERKENRAYDKGRLYLFAVPDILSDEMILSDFFLQYIQQGNVNERISRILTERIDWKMRGNCQSIYHDFSYAEGETALRKIAVYAPRMSENENFQWILLFEEFKDSALSDTLYHNKELIVQNLIIFPYWYECKSGDTLWEIVNQYTNTWNFGNSEKRIREVCESPLNQIENPDLILPGQKVFIAPHLFLR